MTDPLREILSEQQQYILMVDDRAKSQCR
jgi:hypothetical protein